MKNILLKDYLPHVLVLVLFIILSFLYFSPAIEGMEMPQMDYTHSLGMSKELVDFEKQYPGEHSMWTTAMFAGMPAYQIKMGETFNVYVLIQRVLRFSLPYTTVSILFIYLLGFYILLISLKFDKWFSFLGAVAFAFASFNIIIISVGHITQTYAIAYMAPVIAGVLLTFDKRYWLGGIITTIALGIEISTSHLQITYYLGLLILFLVIVKFVYAIIEKKLKEFALVCGILGIAAIFAVLPNITPLITTYEYAKESIRGKSELTPPKGEKKSAGLDKDYAMSWSYGVGETFTLLVPNVKGGASEPIGNNTSALEKVDPQFRENVAQASSYFGDKPFTSGPVYVGAIVCFLFVFGLFIIKGPVKWWLLAGTVFSIMLSWGRNFTPLSDLFFYYFPLYNKFRTVEMILIIAGFTIPLLAMLAVKEILDKPSILKEKRNWFFAAFGLTGGLALLFWILPTLFFSFTSPQELYSLEQQKLQDPRIASIIPEFIKNLEIARVAIFRSDAIRSFLFIFLAASIIFVYSLKQFKKEYLAVALGLLIIADLWVIDKRFLNNSNFQSKSSVQNQFIKFAANDFILKDVDPNFRVLNLTQDLDKDAFTPYFHKSIGGYHGAKLRRYQDIIDRYLSKNIQQMNYIMQNDSTGRMLPAFLDQAVVLNMLNTKYIIYERSSLPIINFKAYGNAWFVPNYKIVENADQEITELATTNPKTTAIIDKRFTSVISQLPKNEIFSQDTGKIELVSFKPSGLIYKTLNRKDQLAVFSEIYYPYGWNAYIDGKKQEHIRVNYILRGLLVPAGKHTVEFKFEPTTYTVGQTISLSTSILVVLFVLGVSGTFLFREYKTKKHPVNVEVKNEPIKKGEKKK